MILLLTILSRGGTVADDFPEEDPPDPPPNTRPYMLEPPFNVVYVDEEFEWEGRVEVEDNDTVEWDLTTNMTEDDYTEFEWEPENYSFKLNIKTNRTFVRWINVSVTDNFFPAAYWNWTLFSVEDDGGTRGDGPFHHTDFYWCGSNCGGDGYQWDVNTNWRTSGWVVPAVGEYPKDNDDRAFFNETADDLYLIHGANSVVTIGELKVSSGFTGSVTMSIDLILDTAGAHDGHMEVSAGTWDVNTSNEQINMDGDLDLLSTGTYVERAGILITQGAKTEEVRVQDSNVLYKFTVDTASTVAELFDNLTLYQLTIGASTIYKVDAATQGYELWTNFTDSASCGFVATSTGILDLDGVYGGRQANITTADPSPPPTSYWDQQTSILHQIENATISYFYYFNLGHWQAYVINTTFDTYTKVNMYQNVVLRDSILTNCNLDGIVIGTVSIKIDNLTIPSACGRQDIYANGRVEMVESTFDESNCGAHTTANDAFVSANHNDTAGRYVIFIGTTLSKVALTTHIYSSGDDVELLQGTFTIDEGSTSNDFTVESGSTLILNSGQTHRFDDQANFTVAGLAKLNGVVDTASGYFDFYNTGQVWLNDSTVTDADLVLTFDFYIAATNSTLNDYTANVGNDMLLEVSSETYANKDLGIVWHMNTTLTSCVSCFEAVEFDFGNLTTGEVYELYNGGVLVYARTANAGGMVYFVTVVDDTGNHLYLTHEAVAEEEEEEEEEREPRAPVDAYVDVSYDLWNNEIVLRVRWDQSGGPEPAVEKARFVVVEADGVEIGSYTVVDGVKRIPAPWSYFDGGNHNVTAVGFVWVEWPTFGGDQMYHSDPSPETASNFPRFAVLVYGLFCLIALVVILPIKSVDEKRKEKKKRREQHEKGP